MKNVWKRMAALLMAGIMTASFWGCADQKTGGTETQEEKAGAETAAEETANEEKEFYMVAFNSGYPYWKQVFRGFEDAGKQYGVKTILGGSTKYDLNESLTAFEQVVAMKPAGIAVTAMDAEAYAPIIDKAIEAGIPVVTFDIDSPKSKRISYIGTQNYDAGANAAHYIGEQLGGMGKVAAITNKSQANIVERIKGFEETLAEEYPGIQVVQIVDSGDDETAAANNAASLLTSHKDIDYILATTVIASSGGQQAVAEAGLSGKTKIVAFDIDTVTLDAIGAGTVEATISQAPWVQGYWSMVYLYHISAGMITSAENWQENGYPSLPATADSGTAIVTKENYEIFYTEQ